MRTSLVNVALTLGFTESLVSAATCGTCESFGVDFQDGGSYFQNSLSNADFTAVQEFEGCADDTAYNVLVDPSGNQYQCTNTPLTPADTPEVLTCPIEKSQLTSGEWSILVLSNNGDCNPIDYQRDFSLSVGPQQTVTQNPTVTISTTTTPVVNQVSTTTTTLTSTAPPKTTDLINLTGLIEVFTLIPLPRIVTVTTQQPAITITHQTPKVATSTAKITASCSKPAAQRNGDPVAKIIATILSGITGLTGNLEADGVVRRGDGSLDAGLAQPTGRSASTEFKRAIIEGRKPAAEVQADFLEERHRRLALNKRSPDQPTVTVQGSSAVTATSTSTAPAITNSSTSTVFKTVTTTPTVTVILGITVPTITLAPSTITVLSYLSRSTSLVTVPNSATVTLTSVVTPAGSAAACASSGGIIIL